MPFPIAAGPAGGMTPAIIDRVYELAGLRALGLHGEGQTVAIVSLDTFDPADVAAFDRIAGVTGPPVEKVKVNGGVASPGDGQGEVNLDIDVIRGGGAQGPDPRLRGAQQRRRDRGGHRPDRRGRPGRHRVDQLGLVRSSNRSTTSMARMASSMAAAATAGITRLRGERRPRRLRLHRPAIGATCACRSIRRPATSTRSGSAGRS